MRSDHEQVPNTHSPPLRTSRGPPGGLKANQVVFANFCHFFSTKSGLEPNLGGLGGQAGCQNIKDILPYHPKKSVSKKAQPILSYSRFNVIPLLRVNVIPLLGGGITSTPHFCVNQGNKCLFTLYEIRDL